MKLIHELEAWSVPGYQLDAEYAKQDLQQALWAAGVPRDVFLGLSFIPDAIDCENLKLSIQSGELSQEAFGNFCKTHGLAQDLQSRESAARFLEFVHGRCLAWIHLPADADPSFLRKIQELLKARGHVVVDPDAKRQA